MTSFPPYRSTYRLAVPRPGATALESAFVLPVVLLMLFALLDLGLAAVRYNALAEAARAVAREAIIHGSLAPDSVTEWGPGAYSGAASSDNDMARPAQSILPTMRLEDVAISVTWPDGDNSPRDRVRVLMAYQHVPLLPGLFVWGPIDLRAETLMRIVN